MSKSDKKVTSIRARLSRVSFVTALVFVLLGGSIFIASEQIWDKADLIVEERLQQIIQNSHNSRDFGQIYSRISVFRNTFYGSDEFLKSEGQAIQDSLNHLRDHVAEEHLGDLLGQLTIQVEKYRQRGLWVNNLLAWRTEQDQDLIDLLRVLQEVIAERIVETALSGGDVGQFDQLVLLLSGYRESMFEIAKLNAEEDRALLLAARYDDLPPLTEELDGLSLRLKTLTASEPQVARFGRHLISRVSYYKYLMQLYQLELIQLNRQNVELDILTNRILESMAVLDQGIVDVAAQTRGEVRHAIDGTIAVILGFLFFLAFLSWRVHQNLFREHIQVPMEQVSLRLNDFYGGDHSTPMQLGRNDEWAGIEEVFNRTIGALQESVTALSESEKRYREIFTNTTEGIFRSSLAGEFLELNPAAVRMLGCESLEEARTYFTDLGSQLYQDPSIREEMIERLKAEGTILNFETLMRRKNGERFWAILSNYLIWDEDSNTPYIEGTMRDISEHKKAHETLQEMKVFLQNIIDSMPSLLICLDREMRITLWNRMAAEESIAIRSCVKGLLLEEACSLFTPETYMESLKQTMESRQPSRLTKIESIRKAADGLSRYFDMIIFPLSQAEDSGVVIYIDEVTERTRFEERMVRSEKMRSVGSLASGLAHEINNPLAAILQNAQVLSRRISPDLKQNIAMAEELGTTMEVISEYFRQRGCEKMVQSITDAGQRTAKIVANVQSFSRNDAVTFSPCDVSELIERTLDLVSSDYDMRHHYNFQKIQIVREFDSVPEVACEMSQIQQALLILFKNAAQAMSVNTESPCLAVRLVQSDDAHVRIQVEDNGQGMDAEKCSQVFDPFFTTLDVGSGAGLGLSIAYFIVTQTHNGNMSVSSEEGRGSCFDIVLPVTH